MKIYAFLMMAIIAASCGSKHTSTADTSKSETTSQCPENGTCTFEVLKNKTLNIKEDEFGNLYPEIEDGDAVVLKFEFKRDEMPDTVDDNYSELIYLQVDMENPDVQLENEQLKASKVLFARLCFCRGQTGYYRIDKGALSIVKSDGDRFRLKLNFKCEAVPQIIKELDETFSL